MNRRQVALLGLLTALAIIGTAIVVILMQGRDGPRTDGPLSLDGTSMALGYCNETEPVMSFGVPLKSDQQVDVTVESVELIAAHGIHVVGIGVGFLGGRDSLGNALGFPPVGGPAVDPVPGTTVTIDPHHTGTIVIGVSTPSGWGTSEAVTVIYAYNGERYVITFSMGLRIGLAAMCTEDQFEGDRDLKYAPQS